MGTHRLGDWLNLSNELSLSTQRVKLIIIISFLLISFPVTINFAKNTGKKSPAKPSQDSVKHTYTHYQIDGSELTKVKDANFLNSLIGRMPGATINPSASGVGGAVRMIWRGYRSVMRSNSMLYTLDGIPLPQLETEQPNSLYDNIGQTGDGIAAFASDDIESISILSPVAASVLYGSRSAGGVMMINTQKGHSGKLRIQLGNSTTFSSPLAMPEFQNTYGIRWGDKIAHPLPWNPADFFRTGHNINNSLSIAGGNEYNQTRFSAVTMNGAGITPNNDVNRYNFSLRNTSSLLNHRLKLDYSLQYIHTNEQNMLAQGGVGNPLYPIYLIPDVLQKKPVGDSPASGSLSDYPYRDNYERYNQELGVNTQYWDIDGMGMGLENPYWIVNRNLTNRDKNRWLTSLKVGFDVNSWLNVTARFSYDQNKEDETQKLYASSLMAAKLGSYYESNVKTTQFYTDLMLNVHKTFGSFSINAALGTSYNKFKMDMSNGGGGLKTVNRFNWAEVGDGSCFYYKEKYRSKVSSLFMIAQLGYKQRIFLDLGGRMEWLKTSEPFAADRSKDIVYPSAGIFIVPTGWMADNSDAFLPYLRFNYNYSETGNSSIYRLPSNKRSIPEGIILREDDYKPERTKSHELGMNTALFNGKVDLDFTVYKTTTSDLPVPVSGMTSDNHKYSITTRGCILENKGMELAVGTNLNLGQVKWNGHLTYTINKNRIKQINTLSDYNIEITEISMFSTDGCKIPIRKGGSVGDIYVADFERDEQGKVIVDNDSKTIKRAGEYVYAGNANPKYTMGLANNFSWKGVELNFVIHARVGGVGVSYTRMTMDYFGSSKATANARDVGGVRVGDAVIPAQNFYSVAAGGKVGSVYTYDATNIRLAEMSIAYHIPVRRWVNWMQDVRVALIGRNLLMIYKKAPVDPESTASTGTWYQGIDHFRQPSCRNMGFSVNLTF